MDIDGTLSPHPTAEDGGVFIAKVHDEDRDKVLAYLDGLRRGSPSGCVEYRYATAPARFIRVREETVPLAPLQQDGWRLASVARNAESAAGSGGAEHAGTDFFALLDGVVNGVFIHRNWQLLYANQPLAQLLGYDDPGDLLTLQNVAYLVTRPEVERLWQHGLVRQGRGAAFDVFEAELQRKDGSTIPAELHERPVQFSGVDAVETTVVDLSERKALRDRQSDESSRLRMRNRKLSRHLETLQASLEHISAGVAVFDASACLVVCNRRYAEIYGISREDLRSGVSAMDIVERRIRLGAYPGSDAESYRQACLGWIRDRVSCHATLALNTGHTVTVTKQLLSDGGWIAIHEDATEFSRMRMELARANLDTQSGLPTRRYLGSYIRSLQAQAICHAVLAVDIDYFKPVEGRIRDGAEAALVRAFGRRLTACLGNEAIIASLGGRRFGIVQSFRDIPGEALALGDRICALGERAMDDEGCQVMTSISVGIAPASQSVDSEELIQTAERAAHEAKRQGGGRCLLFDREMDARLVQRRNFELDLKLALERRELHLIYQPVLDIDRNEISLVEAMPRWNHHAKGAVLPNAFIPVAEQSSLIDTLGAWAIATACDAARLWPPHVKLAVTLSAAQLRSEAAELTLTRAIADSGIDPRRLELAISESGLMQRTDNLLDALYRLHSLGAAIVLDDFGTGPSCLSNLCLFPFDKVKFDRRFTSNLGDKRWNSIVDAVVAIGGELSLLTAAKGVDTSYEYECLRAAGCNALQGHYVGAPCSAKLVGQKYFAIAL